MTAETLFTQQRRDPTREQHLASVVGGDVFIGCRRERHQDAEINVVTRIHSDFEKMIDFEKQRAQKIMEEMYGIYE